MGSEDGVLFVIANLIRLFCFKRLYLMILDIVWRGVEIPECCKTLNIPQLG